MEFVDVASACFREPLSKMGGRFLTAERLKFAPNSLDWWIKIVLTMRAAQEDQTNVVWHFLSNQVSDEDRVSPISSASICALSAASTTIHSSALEVVRLIT